MASSVNRCRHRSGRARRGSARSRQMPVETLHTRRAASQAPRVRLAWRRVPGPSAVRSQTSLDAPLRDERGNRDQTPVAKGQAVVDPRSARRHDRLLRHALAHERAHVIPDRVLRDVELARIRSNPSLPPVGRLPVPCALAGAERLVRSRPRRDVDRARGNTDAGRRCARPRRRRRPRDVRADPRSHLGRDGPGPHLRPRA